ncbi:MAG: hypothetical protein M3R04_08005 [bacterium]|nr:hypothetical protein [bacterium]
MRNAFSLTLVLLAAMSGQAASAAELAGAQHPLRLLMSAGSCQVDQGDATFSFEIVPDTNSGTALRTAPISSGNSLPTAEPASSSHELALASANPVHGP